MTPGEVRAAHVREIRSTLGLGLREAHDAFLRYGSAQLAIEALGTPAKRDAFEGEYDRLRAENKALAASHQRLKEALGKTTLLLAPANEHCSQAYLFNQMAEAFAVCEGALKDAQ